MQNNLSTQFVRGGQTTQHWWRMAVQVVLISLGVTFCIYAGVVAYQAIGYFELPKVRLAWIYWLSMFNVESRGTPDTLLRYIDLSNIVRENTAREIYTDPFFRTIYFTYEGQALFFLRNSVVPAAASFVVAVIVFFLAGRALQQEDHVRGAQLVDKPALLRWSRRKWRDYEASFKGAKTGPRFELAGVPFPPNAVEAGTAIMGTVGTGKTTVYHELLDNVVDQGSRAIVYDRTGALIRDHYVPDRDIIINPFDQRSQAWTPFYDASSPADFAQMASVLIPDKPTEHDAFWTKTSRIVFENAARRLSERRQGSIAKLIQACLMMSREDLEVLVHGTAAGPLMSKEASKTAASIRANMVSELRFLEFLREDASRFSMKAWVKDRTEPGLLFLTAYAEQETVNRSINSTLLELAVSAMMTLEETRDPRIWFFLDELPSLNKIPCLDASLAQLRQFGGAFVIGYQLFSQLEHVYGPQSARTIAGVVNNTIAFNTPDPTTAEMISKRLGEEDVYAPQQSISVGYEAVRDGVQVVSQRVARPIVTASQLQTLEQFKAYVRFAYEAPTAELTFKPRRRKPSEVQPKFVPYRGTGFCTGALRLSRAKQDLSEKQQGELELGPSEVGSASMAHEFLSWSGTRQLAEFKTWKSRHRIVTLDDPTLFRYYAAQRVRGTEPAEIGMPSGDGRLIGNSSDRAPLETLDIPFPGDDARAAPPNVEGDNPESAEPKECSKIPPQVTRSARSVGARGSSTLASTIERVDQPTFGVPS